jgi:hypothetical protein
VQPKLSSIFRRTASLFLTGAAAVAFQGIVVQTASAHHLTVTASAACQSGAAVINYTAISWDQTDIAGSNPEIDILFNGVKVDSQPFTLATTPPNQFSGQKPAPAATNTVDVEGVAVGTWLDGVAGGQTSTVPGLVIPTDCAPGTGRFTGGGKQVMVGTVTITKGFEVDCDLHQPSNNMEINWADLGEHQFHLESFTSAVCTLVGDPTPPKAPVNKIVATGTGRLDGVDGYNIIFTLIDNGEPGAGNDEAGFLIFSGTPPPPGTGVVLNFPLSFVTDGNIQAHVDQR